MDTIVSRFGSGQSKKGISKDTHISESIIKRVLKGYNKPRKHRLSGKKFGRLTVIDKVGVHKNDCPIVSCKCECGKITNVIVSNLTRKSLATVSCGCYRYDKCQSKNPWLTEYNAYIGNTVKRRNYVFDLTLDEFKSLCSDNCYYCGQIPSTKMDVGKGLKNGIDRIDSNKGHTMDNCVSCCWTCNRMKGNMTQQNFLEHISKINVFSN